MRVPATHSSNSGRVADRESLEEPGDIEAGGPGGLVVRGRAELLHVAAYRLGELDDGAVGVEQRPQPRPGGA